MQYFIFLTLRLITQTYKSNTSSVASYSTSYSRGDLWGCRQAAVVLRVHHRWRHPGAPLQMVTCTTVDTLDTPNPHRGATLSCVRWNAVAAVKGQLQGEKARGK